METYKLPLLQFSRQYKKHFLLPPSYLQAAPNYQHTIVFSSSLTSFHLARPQTKVGREQILDYYYFKFSLWFTSNFIHFRNGKDSLFIKPFLRAHQIAALGTQNPVQFSSCHFIFFLQLTHQKKNAWMVPFPGMNPTCISSVFIIFLSRFSNILSINYFSAMLQEIA